MQELLRRVVCAVQAAVAASAATDPSPATPPTIVALAVPHITFGSTRSARSARSAHTALRAASARQPTCKGLPMLHQRVRLPGQSNRGRATLVLRTEPDNGMAAGSAA